MVRNSVAGVFLVLLSALASASCGLFVQDSVTFHGTRCSDSQFWMGGDLVVAGGVLYGASTEGETSAGLIPAAALVASAAAGYYKRSNCLAHKRGASPEEWARDARNAQERAEAQARAMQLLQDHARANQAQPAQQTTRVQHSSYKKEVRFECNGTVIIDQTFRSYEACDQYRRQNPLYCSGMQIPIDC